MTNSIAQRRTQPFSLKTLYLALTVVSLVVSWGIFLQFLLSGEASIAVFFQQALANPISILFSSDVIISAIVFFAFAYVELKRLGMSPNRLAVYFVTTFSIGVCFSLALFLYQRESWLSRIQPQP